MINKLITGPPLPGSEYLELAGPKQITKGKHIIMKQREILYVAFCLVYAETIPNQQIWSLLHDLLEDLKPNVYGNYVQN